MTALASRDVRAAVGLLAVDAELARSKLLRLHANRLALIGALATPQLWTAHMASSGKKKTTMAKLARESRLRERRMEKQAKKDARKQAPTGDRDRAAHTPTGEDLVG